MIFESLPPIQTTFYTFEEHLRYFLLLDWPEMQIFPKPIGTNRRRYEICYREHSQPDIGNAGDIFCEIETVTLDHTRIEVRIAAIDLGEGDFHEAFFQSLYKMIYRKWLIEIYETPDRGDLNDYPSLRREIADPVGYRKRSIQNKLGMLSSYYNEEDLAFVQDELDETRLPELMIELKRRLPPIEEYEYKKSTRPKKIENIEAGKPKGGRPPLDQEDHEEFIYRLAKAQEAEDIRKDDPSKRWKEIALELSWRHGTEKAGVKLLEIARKKLKELTANDPDGILEEVKDYRRKETKETNKT